MNELDFCPLCGGHVIWCRDCCETQDCYDLECSACQAVFDLTFAVDPDDELSEDELRAAIVERFNRRWGYKS